MASVAPRALAIVQSFGGGSVVTDIHEGLQFSGFVDAEPGVQQADDCREVDRQAIVVSPAVIPRHVRPISTQFPR